MKYLNLFFVLSFGYFYSIGQNRVLEQSSISCFIRALPNIKGKMKDSLTSIHFTEKLSNKYKVVNNKNKLEIYDVKLKKVKLFAFDSDIEDWNSVINWDSVKMYLVNKNRYLLGIAPFIEPTGLAVNFNQWIIVDLYSGNFILFQNIIDAPLLFFNNNNSLEFYSIDFSDDFFKYRNEDSISFVWKKNYYTDNKVKSENFGKSFICK